MSNCRVVFCAYDNPENISGPNVWLRRLLPRLMEHGIAPEAWFFSLDVSDSPTSDWLNAAGVPVRCFPFHSRSRQKVEWLLQNMADSPPSVFVPNLVIPAFYAASLLRVQGIPTIGVVHSDDNFYHALVREFAGHLKQVALSNLVCVSDHLVEELTGQIDSSVKVVKIPYGIPVPGQTAQLASPLELVFVGRLQDEQKRITDVTRAFCRAVKEIDGISARIIGDGPALGSLRQLVAAQGCENRVELVGRVDSDQILNEMLRSHVIVLLSDYEGLPIALMEGMACGLVPICTKIDSGIPELVRHGENGLLVDNRGDDFIAAVRKLRETPGLWGQLSVSARKTIETSYRIETGVTQWSELLKSLAQENRTRSQITVPKRINLPARQKEFVQEDFRVHHLMARAINRLKRTFV